MLSLLFRNLKFLPTQHIIYRQKHSVALASHLPKVKNCLLLNPQVDGRKNNRL